MNFGSILLIGSTSAIAAPSANQGFFLDDWKPLTFNAPKSAIPGSLSVGAAKDTVRVLLDTITKVPRTIFGQNAAAWQGNGLPKDTTRMNLFQALNIDVLRYPGGSWSDEHFWNHTTPTYAYLNKDGKAFGQHGANWEFSTDQYYGILKQFGSHPLIIVNGGYARYGSLDSIGSIVKAASLAAGWVRDAKSKGQGGGYWEIGNELFGDWEAGAIRKHPTTGALDTLDGNGYGQMVSAYLDSMRAADPTIKIGAVAIESRSFQSWTPARYKTWNARLLGTLKAKAKKPDFLIIHHYTSIGDVSSFASILSSVSQIPNDLADVRKDLQAAGFNPAEIPIALTEFNLGGKYNYATTSYASAMWYAANLGELINNGAGLASTWELAGGCDSAGTVNHSIISYGSRDCGQPFVPTSWPNPAYHQYFYYTRMFGDVSLVTRTSSPTLRAWASRWSSGEYGLVVVNQSGQSRTTHFDIKGMTPGESAWRYELETSDTTTAEKVNVYNWLGKLSGQSNALTRMFRINGVEPPRMKVDGVDTVVQGGPDPRTVPAKKIALTGPIHMELKPWSINFIVFQSQSSANATRKRTASQRPFAAYSDKSIVLEFDGPIDVGSFKLVDPNGKTVQSGDLPSSSKASSMRIALLPAITPGYYTIMANKRSQSLLIQ